VTRGGGLAYDRYRVNGRDEWMMRIGAADAAPILFLPPLFEEMNRTRAFIADIMRAVSAQGFGCWLPDLPGTGESETALGTVGWHVWRHAAAEAGANVKAASGQSVAVASLRGGCLLDDGVEKACLWRFAPAMGASLARDLVRASALSPDQLRASEVELAGYPLLATLLAELGAAEPAVQDKLRTVRLASDPAEADHKEAGAALWRRSEPGRAPTLSEALAEDLCQWVHQCAA
jgi:pimeloyl-ACP methyl ester carboxylesterase